MLRRFCNWIYKNNTKTSDIEALVISIQELRVQICSDQMEIKKQIEQLEQLLKDKE